MTVNTDLNVRLLDVLRAASGRPDLSYADQPESLSGGFWAVLLAFALADPPPGWPRRLVARVMPDAGTARKETIVQSAVAAAGFPTPSVRVSGGPDDGLGQAFMIMDRASGSPLLPDLSGAAAVGTVFRLPRQIPDVLASTMARLHALDPEPVRAALVGADGQPREPKGSPGGEWGETRPSTVAGLVDMLRHFAGEFGRADLVEAANWLGTHPLPPAPDVICHGDLHPFNLLVDGGQVTLLDWSACLLAPRAHDVAFTAFMLSEPPVRVPGWLRPLIRLVGRLLAARFKRRYQAYSGVTVAADEIAWHQAVVCLRALTEAASWAADGTIDDRAGHPWLVCGPELAAHLARVTGAPVRPR